MITIAAVGDVHFGTDSAGTLRPSLEHLSDRADLFLLAGDLTKWGHPDEAAVLAEELAEVRVPTIAVLGNHDYHLDQEELVRKELEASGVQVLERETTTVDTRGGRVGVVGVKGFGGGFAGASATDFGEPEMKTFIRHTKALADRLQDLLQGLEADVKVVLLHYSPIEGTLQGERRDVYPFLGSYLLAEAVDRVGGADLVLHGHAHRGTEKGLTPGGAPVRNVAEPVIQHAYNLYCLGDGDLAGAPS